MRNSPRVGALRRSRQALACVLLVVVAACDPVFVFPGGELSGTERPLPADWEFTRDFQTIQLEARPSDPYSVNVWGVAANRKFYVASDGGESRWARVIEADPRVRLRIGDDIFKLAAKRAVDPDELEDVIDAYIEKYGGDRERSFVRDAWVYRLGSR